MKRAPLAALAVALAACQGAAPTSSPTVPPPLQAKEAPSFLEATGLPIASPDGKLIVIAPFSDATATTAVLFDNTGTKLGEIAGLAPGFFPEWLPDSSGLLVARGSRTAYTLEIVERDLRVTSTGLTGGSPASLRPSPDGKVLAVETTEQIWTFSRANPAMAAPLAGTKGRQLVGWDAKGNVLTRQANMIYTAPTESPPRALPADLEADHKISFTFTTSPDRTVNVIGSTRTQGRGVYVSLVKIFDAQMPRGWVGPHAALVTHNGKFWVFDGVTGEEKPIAVPERARIADATERDIIWTLGDELHVSGVADGSDRLILGAQTRETSIVPLGTEGLLIYSSTHKKAWLVELHPRSS